jgi:hypothetical protein
MEEIAALAAWTVRWLPQLTGHSERPTLYGVISDQTTLNITGDQRAHARLRCTRPARTAGCALMLWAGGDAG